MEEEIRSAEQFFKGEVLEALDRLTADMKPAWGLMTPQHMVEHLIINYKLAIGRVKVPMAVTDEEAAKYKKYLMQDSPMRRNVGAPTGNNDLLPLRFENLHIAIEKLKEEIIKYDELRKEEPNKESLHPYGGPMNLNEWFLFQRKHFKHHFIQFGLIPDYE